jgi:predicted Zn-dependent protease
VTDGDEVTGGGDRRRAAVTRAAVIVLAIAAIGWLALSVQSTRAEDELSSLAREERVGDLDRAAELRRTAERFVPGRRPSMIEATLRVQAGDRAGAVRILEDVVHDEPENGEAWLLLARAAEDVDPGLAERAMARVRELAPPVPPPG